MYNQFPWLFKWIANRKELHRLNTVTKDQNLKIFSQAQKTLNPQKCRGFVDAFLAHKQNLEVRKPLDEMNREQAPETKSFDMEIDSYSSVLTTHSCLPPVTHI